MTSTVPSLFAGLASSPSDLCMLLLKSKLWSLLTQIITDQGLTQTQTAKALQVSQPRVCNMMKGQLDKFSVEFFIESLMRMGHVMDLHYTPHNEDQPITFFIRKAQL